MARLSFSASALAAGVLAVLLASSSALATAAASATAAPPRRHLTQLKNYAQPASLQQQSQTMRYPAAVNAFASAPVSVNAAPAAAAAPAKSLKPVKAATLGKGFFGLPGAGTDSTVVVLPTPAQTPIVAAPTVPTTTVLPPIDGGLVGGGGGVSAGSLSLSTSSPVEVNAPVNVSTPVRQSSSQKGGKTVSAPILGLGGLGKKPRGGVTATNALGVLGAGVGVLNLLG
jgi:hypothetical protein